MSKITIHSAQNIRYVRYCVLILVINSISTTISGHLLDSQYDNQLDISQEDYKSYEPEEKKVIRITPGGIYYFTILADYNRPGDKDPVFVHLQNEHYVEHIRCKLLHNDGLEYACEIKIRPFIPELPEPNPEQHKNPIIFGVFKTMPKTKTNLFDPLFYISIEPKINH